MLLLLHGDTGPGFMLFGYDLPRIHAVVNDFPPALLVTAVIFELLAIITKRESFRAAGYWTLLAGVIGTGLAVLTGLGAEDHIAHGQAVHDIMEEHEELAYWTLGIFAVVALWRIVRERTMGSAERLAAFLVALVGTAVLVDTGKHGGEMVFDHAAGISNEVMAREMLQRSEGHQHEEGEDDEDDEHDHSDHP